MFNRKYDLQRSDLKVRCGEWDMRRAVEPIPHQDRVVVRTAVHPGFSGKNLTDNVALLFTDRPFVLGPHLDKICLPNSAIYPFDPEECYATGWGKDAFGDEGKFQARG